VNALINRLRQMPRELFLFAIASLVLGMAYSMMDSTLNNFLNETFTLDSFQRSFLEFPRELPGFLVVFVSAALWFLCSRRLGVFALGLAAAGAALVGFFSVSYGVMVIWLFIYSMGQHLFMPLATTIGMELAHEGKTGQRLGQLNALRNLATIMGSFIVFLGFRFLGFTFQHTFALAAIGLTIAAVLMFLMQPEKNLVRKPYLQLHKEYTLFYILSVLYGTRKQLFITFAPWVLVTVFKQPTSIMATLMTVGGVIGILFQPFLGRMVDRLGERTVLAAEAVALVLVCLGYGFSTTLFSENAALAIVIVCYLLDQMLMSVSMARSTYMKKTAVHPTHVQPALTAGLTIDHIFSIGAALLGGYLWNTFGFQAVFIFGACIAVVNFFFAMQVRLPAPGAKTAQS